MSHEEQIPGASRAELFYLESNALVDAAYESDLSDEARLALLGQADQALTRVGPEMARDTYLATRPDLSLPRYQPGESPVEYMERIDGLVTAYDAQKEGK